jgi:LuxR family maltose regulon positive regulatory protein
LRDLTDEQLSRSPWLSLSTAWLAFQTADTDRMDRWILHCERHAGPDWKRRAGEEPYAAALAFLVALVGRCDLAESQSLCEASVRGLPPDEGFRAAALFIHGVTLTLTRRTEEGARRLEEAGRLARVLDVPLIQADALSWRGVLAMAEGDHPTGQRLIMLAREVILEHRLERLASSAHCITAQALVQALRRDPEAPTTLATARRLTVRLGDIAPWFEVCGRLIQAKAATALGEAGLARQLILEATTRMTPDLRGTLAQDLLDDAEESLARVRSDGVYTPALTAMEMRVLQFLPSHLQLPQIGEHLFVTQNTIKTHVRSIHRKLGVSSRAQAVERARELGLLESPAYD